VIERIRGIRPLPSFGMRARAALVAAVLVAVPLAFGSFLATDFYRRHLLDEARQTIGRGVDVLDTGRCAGGTGPVPAEMPPGVRQHCVPGKQEVRTETIGPDGNRYESTALVMIGEDPGALSLWLWPDFIGGSGRPSPMTMVHPEETVPAAHRLVTETDLRREQSALDRMAQRTAGAAAALVLLTAGGAWWVTARALRPMEAIRRQFTEVSTHHLDRRVPVPRRDTEIARLARTMNATLDRLQDSVEQQRRFTADASHELRTPLSALRAELEIALTRPGETDWPAVVERAAGDTVRLQHLTDDLLMLARLDAGAALRDGARPLDLARLVREECARRALPAHLTLTVPDGTPVVVPGREPLLTRILANLLDNAERYAAARITVTLTPGPGVGTAVLTVADDGPGIPAEDRARVFESFTRLDDARGRATGGTGLGLAIAARIAALHRGTLTIADSREGACFLLTLPTTDDPLPGERPSAAHGRELPAGP
jgi:signal transduction histidine kinase